MDEKNFNSLLKAVQGKDIQDVWGADVKRILNELLNAYSGETGH